MELTHGGDIEGYERRYGARPLDFSVNCNPFGVPPGVVRAISEAAAHINEYPDPLCRRLREAISAAEGVDSAHICCGNGAADLIFRIPAALRPRRALITAPCFSEYEAALRLSGCEVSYHTLHEENAFRVCEGIFDDLHSGLDMLIICNPNNPTGHALSRGFLLRLRDACMDLGITLVIDECFVPFLQPEAEYTLKHDLRGDLIILRAFTKLYAMAGVRLGYCLCANGDIVRKIGECAQPWSVSLPAQEAGIAALSEHDYVARSLAAILTEREKLKAALTDIGVSVIGGDANYIFFKCGNTELDKLLARRGILIRSCADYAGLRAGFFRIAVRTAAENDALTAALREVL